MWLKQIPHPLWKYIPAFFKPFSKKALPTFGSSFIQYWYCQNWDHDRWIKEYGMLQKVGIKEIILQSVADTKAHYTVYPTKMEGYTSNNIDMLEIALSAADSMGMNVRVGLGNSDDWWITNAVEQAWLDHEAKVNTMIVEEIVTRYGIHKSLSGWYIPYEFQPLMAATPVQQHNLNRFFNKICNSIKFESTKNIMVAPFFHGGLLPSHIASAFWSNSVHHVLKDTGVDILALQDSVGAGFNKLDHLHEIFAHTKKATEEIGIILYAVTETFKKIGTEFFPAAQGRIQEQIYIESAYVSGFVAFSIDHYQNGNESNQIRGYEDYYRYYLDSLYPKSR